MLERYRGVLLTLTLGLGILAIWAWFFKNPYVLPGLETRTLWVFVPMLLLTLILYIDFTVMYKRLKRSGSQFAKVLAPLARMHVNTNYFFHLAFQLTLVAYLLLLLLSQFVSLGFSLNYLLILTIVFGIITVLVPYQVKERQAMTRWDVALILGLAVIGGVLVYVKTAELGWLQYVISLLSMLLIGLLGFLVFEEDEVTVEYPDIRFSPKMIGVALGVLVVLAVVLGFYQGFAVAFRIVFGSVYVLVLPGLFLSYVFFAHDEIDALERVALSFALSIAVVPLLVFYLNLIGMKITAISVAAVVFGVVIASWLLYRKKEQLQNMNFVRALRGKKRH